MTSSSSASASLGGCARVRHPERSPRLRGARGAWLAAASALLCACGSSDGDGTLGGGGGAATIEPFAVPEASHSHGEPTALEQALLEEIQRGRANPAAEGQRIVALPDVQGALTQFQIDPKQIEAEFAAYPTAPPLAFDPRLIASARFHSTDMAEKGFQQHDGSAGESFDKRIADAGYQFSFASENIFAFATSVPYCHAAFLIDWGNADLGHRITLLDLDDRKRDIGIGIVDDPPSDKVGPLVVTEDFAMPLHDDGRYVVGVAYADANDSGAYDPGEGRSGLRVVPERGDYHAVTSQSGGFALPVPAGFGVLRLQLLDAAGAVVAEAEATVGPDNVKVDFVLPAER